VIGALLTGAVLIVFRRWIIAAALERRGAKILYAPAIQIVPLADDTELRDATERCLAGPLDITLAAVLQHVQVLEASGLVRSQKTGRTRTCSINPAALRSAEQWITARRALWEGRLDRLGVFLEGED